MKFLSLPAFVLSLASVSVATSIQQRKFEHFRRVAIPDNYVPKPSLIARSIPGGVPPLVSEISADAWAEHILSWCRDIDSCTGIAIYKDRHFWVGYLVREGAVDANDFQPGPQLETSGARAFTGVD